MASVNHKDRLTQFMTGLLNGEVKPQEDAQAEMIGLVNQLSKLNTKDSTIYKELSANPEQKIVVCLFYLLPGSSQLITTRFLPVQLVL